MSEEEKEKSADEAVEEEETLAKMVGEETMAKMVGATTSKVSAVPSGSGLTFLVGSDVDESDEDNPERFAAGVVAQEDLDDVDQQDESDEEAAEARRRRELTARFMAGEVSLGELVREVGEAEEDEAEEEEEDEVERGHGLTSQTIEEEEEEETDEDEEWTPGGGKKRKRPPSRRASVDVKKRFEDDLQRVQRQQLTKKRRRNPLGSVRGGGDEGEGGSASGSRSRKRRLDPALQGLMGEANLRYARGDKDTAIRMCMEVIKEDPSAPEPYQTLSTLYEENGDQEKALQFAMLAAHLSPQDADEWARLADMSLELDDVRQAVLCFRKAIHAEPENVRYHLARCGLLERLNDMRGALNGYKRLLALLPENAGADFLHASREAARLLHERDDVDGARAALATAVERHPQHVGVEDVNLLLELMISLGQYDDALDVLCRHGGVKFTAAESASREELERLEPEKQLETFSGVAFADNQPPPMEIKAKLVIVLVNLKANHLSQAVAKEVLALEADEYGDLMLDIAEAMAANHFHDDAVAFLRKLTNSQAYSQAEVWLKYGESLMAVNKVEEAELAYKEVMERAPNHLEARRTLSAILHKLGRPEEALRTLTQDEEAELLNPTLLFERCQLLLKEERHEDFIMKAKLLFTRHFVHIRNRDELHAVASAKKLSSKNKALWEVRNYKRQPQGEAAAANFEQQSAISVLDEFQLFKKLCELLYSRGRYAELQRVAFSALGSPHFNKKPEIVKECEFMCLLASMFNGDSYHAYNLVRELVVKQGKNPKVWNLFNLVVHRADDVRHNRFLMRLMTKQPDNVALGILNGHNCLVAGTYKYSLGEYMSAFKQDPSNPLVVLMLGLTFTHMACQKFSAKKHSLVVQACAFLNQYLKMRGPCQEAYYNLGRAMHQLGLLPAALFYYKKALNCQPMVAERPMFDLRREAAFNVSLIYQGSNAYELASMYVRKYIVI